MSETVKDVFDSTAIETCPTCSGSGKEVVFHNMGSDYEEHFSSEDTCSTCKGSGVTDAEKAAKIRKRNEFWERVMMQIKDAIRAEDGKANV